MTALSSAVEARMEVSDWLKATLVRVSVLVGHWRVCEGAEPGRVRS